MSRVSVVKYPSYVDENSNVIKNEEQFTFLNGDTYTGGFRLVKDQQFLTRQGRGIYLTKDLNEYEAYWSEDQVVGEARICYSNGARYKGTLDIDGSMFGSGVYTFVDNSVLRATWLRNEPVADITMIDPLTGSTWDGVCSGKEIALTAANHFWGEIDPPMGDRDEGEAETQLEIDLDE